MRRWDLFFSPRFIIEPVKRYRAIIFDLNGVLILDKPGYRPSEWEKKIFKKMGLSLDDRREKEAIKRELGWAEQEFRDLVKRGWEGAVPNNELIGIIKNLRKQGYKTGLLSNTSKLLMFPTLKNYFGVDLTQLFGQVIISSEVGLLKPDKAIYQLVLNKLRVPAKRAIYIDDALQYLRGAQELGITGLLFQSNRKLRQDLAYLGIK